MSSISGVFSYLDSVISEKIDPANLLFSSNLINKIVLSSSRFNSGVTATDTSSTGAIAVIIPDKGLETSSSSFFSDHFVLIDKESFPTGIETLRSTLIFDNASTPYLNAASSLFSPEAAIQFAET